MSFGSPVDSGASPNRVDQGKDYNNVKNFFAVAAGKIVNVYQGLSGFGQTIIERLNQNPNQPNSSDYIYYAAENSGLNPSVSAGQAVSAGQQLASGPGGSGGVEVGFWNPSTGKALGNPDFGGSNATPAGQQFVQDISGKARPGDPTTGVGQPAAGSDIAGVFSDYENLKNLPRTAPPGTLATFQWWLAAFRQAVAPVFSAPSSNVPTVAPSASLGPGQAWKVSASQESDGGQGACGPIGTGGMWYSELSTVPMGTASDFAALGKLPCGTVLNIFAPSTGKTVQAAKRDVGAGSAFLPVMGLYPATAAALGLSGGQYTVVISRADGGALHPVRGMPVANSANTPANTSTGQNPRGTAIS